jgi:hypothetical protein
MAPEPPHIKIIYISAPQSSTHRGLGYKNPREAKKMAVSNT